MSYRNPNSNAFRECQAIEIKSLNEILPWVRKLSGGQFVLTNKGPLSEFLQREIGDILLNLPAGSEEANGGKFWQGGIWGLELKTKAKTTGNFFLEVWSNLDFDRRTEGWMVKLKCDVLAYYFQDTRLLHTIPFRRLWRWAFGEKGPDGRKVPGRIYGFTEKGQGKYDQLNYTTGFCVPMHVIKKEVGYAVYHLDGNSFEERSAILAGAKPPTDLYGAFPGDIPSI